MQKGKFSTIIKRFYIAALAIPVFTAACVTSPSPMPTGYKYQGEVYKTPPGREPIYPHDTTSRPAETEAVAPAAVVELAGSSTSVSSVAAAPVMDSSGLWLSVSRDLLSRLEGRLGKPMESVYITADALRNPGFEQALVSAMSERGWKYAGGGAGSGPFGLSYMAVIVDPVDPSRQLLTLRLLSGGRVAAEESGIYSVGN